MQAIENIHWHVSEGVAYIGIDRPKRRNALTNAMYQGLADLIHEADRQPEVQCVVIRGANQVFTSGSDVFSFLDKSPIEREHHFDLVANLFMAPARISKPVVAAVEGFALGGGTGLAAACDLVLATEDSVFGIPEVHVGIWPCTLLPALSRAVGPRKAYEMAILGERLSARQALECGLVTRIATADEFEHRLQDMTGHIVSLSSLVVQMGKRAHQQSVDMEFQKATYFMARVMALNSASEDAKEGISAFLHKRQPTWVGK